MFERCNLTGMLATVCSYENLFVPYHPQTLTLLTRLGVAYRSAGEFDRARPLLMKVVRDIERHIGRECEPWLQAMTALRELHYEECNFERAEAIERELGKLILHS